MEKEIMEMEGEGEIMEESFCTSQELFAISTKRVEEMESQKKELLKKKLDGTVEKILDHLNDNLREAANNAKFMCSVNYQISSDIVSEFVRTIDEELRNHGFVDISIKHAPYNNESHLVDIYVSWGKVQEGNG